MITGGLSDMNTHEQKGPRAQAEEVVHHSLVYQWVSHFRTPEDPGFLLTPETMHCLVGLDMTLIESIDWTQLSCSCASWRTLKNC